MGKKKEKKRKKELAAHREKEMKVIRSVINKQFEKIQQLDLSILNDVNTIDPG